MGMYTDTQEPLQLLHHVDMKVQVQSMADGGKHDDTAATKTKILKIIPQDCLRVLGGDASLESYVMDMVIFRTIFFELLVFFTFTLLIIHFAY